METPKAHIHRSPVPDLLFAEDRAQRIADLQGAGPQPDLCRHPEALRPETPLHRITVFVSYRCNLQCGFCKTIVRSAEDLRALPQRAVSMDLEAFRRLLATHAGAPIEHLHLTGGEASLSAELGDMIGAARAHGVRWISMTTNGTLAPEVYEGLVRAGLDELRVSLDPSHQQGARAGSAAVEGPAPARSERTLAHLAAMRKAGAPFHLIVNSVVEPDGVEGLAERLRGLLASGADDIKLITAVDELVALGQHAQRERVMGALAGLLDGLPFDRFPLLRRKVYTVLSPAAIGLETVDAADPWRCFIPLTERTVDAKHYYPCSVYLREGGAPLGDVGDRAEVQRQRSVDFVKGHDCRKDQICARYCLHCTRLYNDDVNRAAQVRVEEARPPVHYLVVSPLGLRHAAGLAAALGAEGVGLGRRWDLLQWADAADRLYRGGLYAKRVHPPQEGLPGMERSARYLRAWRERYPEDRGAIWEVPEAAHWWHLVRSKRRVREGFPNEWAGTGDGGAPPLFLHAFHLPEEEDLADSWLRTRAFRLEGRGG
jgi:pyruvate-formate lyase-activating enzyme